MSFILDALKKSEAERQQQSGGEFANLPSGSGETHSYRWLWILALLLLVNIAVLVGILLRDDAPDAVPDTVEPAEPLPAAERQEQPSFEEQVAAARDNRPPPAEEAAPVQPAVTQSAVVPRPEPTPRSRNVQSLNLPTFNELRVDGTLQMADLHLDIHVFADNPADRFVFINMSKQRENSQLEEGPVIREITPDGVVLEHAGSTFLLPRE